MTGFWVIHLIKGGLPDGIRSLENGGFLAFHITAELLTAVFCIAGGTGLITDSPWGIPVALAAGGMLLYTSINSLAWSEVRKTPKLSVMFIVPAAISIFSIVYLGLNSGL